MVSFDVFKGLINFVIGDEVFFFVSDNLVFFVSWCFGGYGGFDLYCFEYKNGQWGIFVNFGF